MTTRVLSEWARQRGYKVSVTGTTLLEAIKSKLEKLRAEGAFAPGFYEELLAPLRYLEGSSLQSPKTVLIVVVPSPAYILNFETARGTLETVLPPTYFEYGPLFESVRIDILNNVLGGESAIETLHAPLKSLAAATGLVSYGRNNIAYTPELGSYSQLAGYILDIPLRGIGTEIRPARMLDYCSSCRACVRACPRGVISEDRFLIRAERCYTLFSESPRPLPTDIEPPSPDCLIGCLKCQQVCPANKGRLKRVKAAVSFTKEETAALLDDGEIEGHRLGESIKAKFGTLGLTEGPFVFRRNLRRLASLS